MWLKGLSSKKEAVDVESRKFPIKGFYLKP